MIRVITYAIVIFLAALFLTLFLRFSIYPTPSINQPVPNPGISPVIDMPNGGK